MSRSQPKIWRKIQKIGGDFVSRNSAFFHVWTISIVCAGVCVESWRVSSRTLGNSNVYQPHMLPPHLTVDSEHTTQIWFTFFFSMECPQEAPAHRASVDAVQGGDWGLGAAHHAQVMRRTICLFWLSFDYLTICLFWLFLKLFYFFLSLCVIITTEP